MVDVIVNPTQPSPAPMAAPAATERSQARRETLRLLIRRPAFIFGNIIIVGWIICAVLGDRITPYNPFNDFSAGHLPPSPEHWMGTDRIGRDVLSRVMVGSRDVLIVAPLAALLGVAAGTLLGLVMGYYRGRVDDVLSRLVEAFLALPVILVALLTLVVLGTSPLVVVFVVGILFTPIVARTVRSAVLSERELDYVTAAKLRGESGLFILSREIFPNVLGPTVVEMTVRFGYAIFTVATLSFLGVGLQPPSPDWGLSVSQEYTNMISGIWWPTLFPALAIASTVVAVNLIADSLQSVLSE
jgi:peptide/nickel transport system permease protein